MCATNNEFPERPGLVLYIKPMVVRALQDLLETLLPVVVAVYKLYTDIQIDPLQPGLP